MKFKLIFVTLFFLAPLAEAAPFDSIIDAMAIKAGDSQTNNGWEDTAKIQGVEWEWPYAEVGKHDDQMLGKAGDAEITVNGTRAFITDVEITIDNGEQDIKAFGKGNITKIKTSCDDDSLLNTVAFYQFERDKHKPLYIYYQSSEGAGGSGQVDFTVAYQLEDVLGIYPEPCQAL